jgi:hypothetical protein
MLQGGCHCGAVRYEMTEEVKHHCLCHCRDCRVCAGAPVVAWAAVEKDGLKIKGEPQTYQSSEHGLRIFCGHCGTGLFYVNETALPGLVDVQTATLDDPDALPLQLHVQAAERIGWMKTAHELPAFDRYPG